MAEPIHFQAFSVGNWPWGGATGWLGLYSLAQWTDQNDVIHLAGLPDDNAEPLQRCPFTVANGQATVGAFDLEPTVKSIDNRNVLITGVLFDEDDMPRRILFRAWWIPDTPNPMTWRQLTLANHALALPLRDEYGTWAMTLALFAQLQAALESIGGGLPTARGLADMVVDVVAGASQVVVLSNLVTANSVIKAYSMSEGVSGSLRVVERLVGQSFTIKSSVIGDEGLVAWEIAEPF